MLTEKQLLPKYRIAYYCGNGKKAFYTNNLAFAFDDNNIKLFDCENDAKCYTGSFIAVSMDDKSFKNVKIETVEV